MTEFEEEEESFLVEVPEAPEAPDTPEGRPLSSPLLYA